MAYFRKITEKLHKLTQLANRDENWLILINADPDALASAVALRRILSRRAAKVDIAHINDISRPDNLAMIRYLRIPTRRLTDDMTANYDRFALVDSQPHHNTSLADLDYAVVIDHHPTSKEHPVTAHYTEILPDYGANATILTEYLYNLDIKPGKNLATALLYGIKADTQSFERGFVDADVKAFRYLSKLADQFMLKKIVRSEYHLHWLKYFSQAFQNINIYGQGIVAHMEEVDNTDILVILADFFLRVHEITWTIISGVSGDNLIVILRSDGLLKDMGQLATTYLGEIGSAGGHRAAARAEIPVSALEGADPETFLRQTLRLGEDGKCPLV
jgi:nanoRNase/pAp phosphatase (c-di-AMP/oligoRNAs hydrolase)